MRIRRSWTFQKRQCAHRRMREIKISPGQGYAKQGTYGKSINLHNKLIFFLLVFFVTLFVLLYNFFTFQNFLKSFVETHGTYREIIIGLVYYSISLLK